MVKTLHSQCRDLSTTIPAHCAVLPKFRASMVAQVVKNPLAMQAIQVRSLGQQDPLEKRMVTHSSDLAWRIPQRSLTGYTQDIVRGITVRQTELRTLPFT